MLRTSLHVATFAGFLILAGFIGYFLWQALFTADRHFAAAAAGGHVNATEEALAHYTKWLAILTAFLVMATLLLFVSGERNVAVAEQSAQAAREAANAARDSVNLAKQTSEAQLRAYVGVGIRTNPTIQPGSNASMLLEYKNFGTTPAREVRYWLNMDLVNVPNRLPFATRPFREERILLNPGATEHIEGDFGRALTDEEVALIQADQKRLYVWGEIAYTDVFGRGPHITEFRLARQPDGAMARTVEGNSDR
jgi:hypothetical protein